jgi:hypothetical protein
MSGHYESYYVRAVDPERPRAVWIRHTVLQRPGGAPAGSLWCTVWDAEHGAPRAHKETPALAEHAGDGLRTGDAHFGPDRIHGAIRGAKWDLRIEPLAPPLRHLPHPRLYTAPLPRTKLESPAPAARVTGAVDDVTLDGWPGMTGHNWGAQHAERWLWLHGIAFENEPGAWLDVAVGRLRIAGRDIPWVANGALHAGGVTHRLGGLRTKVHVDADPRQATVTVGGTRIRVTSPPGQTVAWVYADPPGGEHHSLNCSIAALEVEHAGTTLRTAHGGVYELGTRDREHGIPVAPFPDP